MFRFEDGQAVEHWDNIQVRQGPNPSGHSMVDGPVEAEDLDRTGANRARVRDFVEHWDTVEKVAPRAEWKNDNGKF